ncbi:hypothetical protein Tco_0696455, partial [Tanacetum coccineum]
KRVGPTSSLGIITGDCIPDEESGDDEDDDSER